MAQSSLEATSAKSFFQPPRDACVKNLVHKIAPLFPLHDAKKLSSLQVKIQLTNNNLAQPDWLSFYTLQRKL